MSSLTKDPKVMKPFNVSLHGGILSVLPFWENKRVTHLSHKNSGPAVAHVTGWNSDAHDILRRTLCKFAGFLDTLFEE